MRWLRSGLAAWYRGFPGAGYAAGLLLFGLIAAVVGRAQAMWFTPWEAVLLILAALFGVAHLVAPRAAWGGKPYWALAGCWLGGAVLGALAHWEATGELSPWLSLGRYALLCGGLLLALLSPILGRAAFAREKLPQLQRLGSRLVFATYLLLAVVAIGLCLGQVSYRVALAPRYQGVRTHLLLTIPKERSVAPVAWSPDSQHLLAVLGSEGKKGPELWVLSLEGRRTRIAADAAVSSQPWLPDGAHFLYYRRIAGKESIWLSSADGRQQRRLLSGGELGYPVCSPDGRSVAFRRGDDLLLTDPGFRHSRRIAYRAWCGAWSGDSSYLLLQVPGERGERRREAEPATWAPATGAARALPHGWVTVRADGTGEPHQLFGNEEVAWPAWSANEIVVTQREVRGRHSWLNPFDDQAAVEVWDVTGKRLRRFVLPEGLSLGRTMPAPAPDGRRVAAALGAQPLSPLASRVYVLDTVTERLRFLTPSGLAPDLLWSPDGRKLAVTSGKTVLSTLGTENVEYYDALEVVTGL